MALACVSTFSAQPAWTDRLNRVHILGSVTQISTRSPRRHRTFSGDRELLIRELAKIAPAVMPGP